MDVYNSLLLFLKCGGHRGREGRVCVSAISGFDLEVLEEESTKCARSCIKT